MIDFVAFILFGAFGFATIGAILWRREQIRRDRAWMADDPLELRLTIIASDSRDELLRGGLITINEARAWRPLCPPGCEVPVEVSLSGHERAHRIRCPEHGPPAPPNPGQPVKR